MSAKVRELVVRERPTAVIAEATTWQAFPRLWPALLDEIWQAIRAGELVSPGRNVMLYRDDVPHVEVGVEVEKPFSSLGRIVCSTLPAGRVATTTHSAPYEELGSGHRAVIEACAERGLQRLGPRWEIYGHWNESAPAPEVEIYYLVS